MVSIFKLSGEFSLSLDTFRHIRDSVNQRFGIFFQEGDRYLLESRLSARLEALQIEDFEQYGSLLSSDGGVQELENAIELLTNNETYFFREDYQLHNFADQILPAIKTVNKKRQQIAVWSAGCSSGEEAYSIAIFIMESGLFGNWDIRVFGSDVSTKMLAKARLAEYGKSAFRNTSRSMQDRYFNRTEDGWQVKNTVRSKCNFSKINLLDANRAFLLGKYDAVFCRNVLMYFDKGSRRLVISHFHKRLHPNGFLLLGHTESLLYEKTPFAQVHLKDALVYQKAGL